MAIASNRALSAAEEIRTVFEFFSDYKEGVSEDDILADLTFGNPHEMPLPGVVNALKAQIEPQSVDWFACKQARKSRAK